MNFFSYQKPVSAVQQPQKLRIIQKTGTESACSDVFGEWLHFFIVLERTVSAAIPHSPGKAELFLMRLMWSQLQYH